jgi:hypothetical protein
MSFQFPGYIGKALSQKKKKKKKHGLTRTGRERRETELWLRYEMSPKAWIPYNTVQKKVLGWIHNLWHFGGKEIEKLGGGD